MADQAALPPELLEAVTKARPRCFWHDQGRCKKGGRCALLHAGANEAHIPHVSLNRKPDGTLSLSVRPPLHDALEKYFEDSKCKRTIGSGRTLSEDSEGHQLTLFELQYMAEPDKEAAEAAITRQCAKTEDGRQPGAVHGQETPQYLMHGTSVENMLSICAEGQCNVGPGIAGIGVYAFRLESMSSDELLRGYKRCSTGGYCGGAALVMRCHGLLIRCKNGVRVPEGCVSLQKDQYAASHASITYAAVIFNTSALVSHLQKYMKNSGYGEQLHQALEAARDFLRNQTKPGASRSTSSPMITITNNMVHTMKAKASGEAAADAASVWQQPANVKATVKDLEQQQTQMDQPQQYQEYHKKWQQQWEHQQYQQQQQFWWHPWWLAPGQWSLQTSRGGGVPWQATFSIGPPPATTSKYGAPPTAEAAPPATSSATLPLTSKSPAPPQPGLPLTAKSSAPPATPAEQAMPGKKIPHPPPGPPPGLSAPSAPEVMPRKKQRPRLPEAIPHPPPGPPPGLSAPSAPEVKRRRPRLPQPPSGPPPGLSAPSAPQAAPPPADTARPQQKQWRLLPDQPSMKWAPQHHTKKLILLQ